MILGTGKFYLFILRATDIEGGVSLSQALQKRPDVFSPFFVNMVKSGEESGKLNEIIEHRIHRGLIITSDGTQQALLVIQGQSINEHN